MQQLPVDVLKIDRSFISRIGTSLHSSTLVRSVVDLALALGLTTIAEGIETQVQLDELRSIHAGRGQGYFFSRPLEASVFEERVRVDPLTHKVFLSKGADERPAAEGPGASTGSVLEEPVSGEHAVLGAN